MSEIIRAANVKDAPGITHVHIASWQTTYRGIMSDEFLDSLSYAARLERRVNHLLKQPPNVFTYVAEDEDGRIVGFIVGGPERENSPLYRGELYAIYVLQEYQGRGLGKRLTQKLVESLLAIDLDTMLVWVLAGNPASNFYQALGGQYLKTKPIEIGGSILDEEAYGWPDIRPILDGSAR